MSIGTLTFGSLARLHDYRSKLTSTANQGQSKTSPIPLVSSQIPTSNLNASTEQALQWSGLKPASSKTGNSLSALLANPKAAAFQSATPSYTAPALDFTYNLDSIKGILAYRDAILARSPEADSSQADENHSEES